MNTQSIAESPRLKPPYPKALKRALPESGLVYLAIPYTHREKHIRIARALVANVVAGRLMKNLEINIFSPISHSHAIAEACDMPTDFGFWKKYDEEILKMCSGMIVLTVRGWDESVGVASEIAFATLHNIPISYLNPESILDY